MAFKMKYGKDSFPFKQKLGKLVPIQNPPIGGAQEYFEKKFESKQVVDENKPIQLEYKPIQVENEENSSDPFKQTYPKSYTKEDIEFLKEQQEDVVRYEDLDEEGKKIWEKQGKPIPPKKKQMFE